MISKITLQVLREKRFSLQKTREIIKEILDSVNSKTTTWEELGTSDGELREIENDLLAQEFQVIFKRYSANEEKAIKELKVMLPEIIEKVEKGELTFFELKITVAEFFDLKALLSKGDEQKPV
jgi:hypothetical protein